MLEGGIRGCAQDAGDFFSVGEMPPLNGRATTARACRRQEEKCSGRWQAALHPSRQPTERYPCSALHPRQESPPPSTSPR
jgi:hypothetical protein